MSKPCSANRTRSAEQSKNMPKESKSMNASIWENHPNERQFLDSLNRFMNESWAAVSQVRERTGLNPQYQMSSTEISKRIGEVSKKLDDKYKEVQALETQKTQLLNKSGPSKGHGPQIAAMRPAPGSPQYGYPDSFDSSISSYGVPRATSSPAHQDTLELSYSGNYSYEEPSGYDDWGYYPSGSSGQSGGSSGRSHVSSPGGALSGQSGRSDIMESSRSVTPRSPLAPSTDPSDGSWNSPHQGRIRTPPPRCPAARGGSPGPRRARWDDYVNISAYEPQRPNVAPRRSPSPVSPVDRGWGAHNVVYDVTPSSEYSTEVSSAGSPRTDPSSAAASPRYSPPPPPPPVDRGWGIPHTVNYDHTPSSEYSTEVSPAGSPRTDPSSAAASPRYSPPPPPPPVDRGWGVPHTVNYDRTPSTEYSSEVSSPGQLPCQSPCRNLARTPEYSSRSEQSTARSSTAYSPRSEYSTGRSSPGLSSHPNSSRGTASRSWNSRVASKGSAKSGHQFSPGGSDRSAAEAMCHPECQGLPYAYRVGPMRE